MKHRTPAALCFLLAAIWGLSISLRLGEVASTSVGSDVLGQYLAAEAVLRGGAPFVPNPEGGHALWVWVLPLVAGAHSLTELLTMRAIQAALVAPVGALAAWVLVGPKAEGARFASARWLAALASGVTLALDPGLRDTLQVAFRGYAAPELIGLATLFGVLALKNVRWALPLAAMTLVGAAGQHPLAIGVWLGALAVTPALLQRASWRVVVVAVGVAAVLLVPRAIHVYQLASCGAGVLTCLSSVASASAEGDLSMGELLSRAVHDRVMVEGPLPWLGLAVGCVLGLLPRSSRPVTRDFGLFVLGATVGIVGLGLSIDTLRPYHLRLIAVPVVVLAAAGLARGLGLPLFLMALSVYQWGEVRLLGPNTETVERIDQVARVLGSTEGVIRVDGVWMESPVGLEPAPLVLAAVLQGTPPETFSLAPHTPVVLVVNGGPASAGGVVLAQGSGWHLTLFEDASSAMEYTASLTPTPVLVGGALDWQKAIHPRPPADWQPGWPPQ